MGKYYGDPVLTVRMPRELINAIKMSARKHGNTLSEHLRDLCMDQCLRDGIDFTEEQVPGQIRIQDDV